MNGVVRDEMRRMLAEIQDGTYARGWIDENRNGRSAFLDARRGVAFRGRKSRAVTRSPP